ncbi:hypothetical protein [Agromyces bauzanensis]
MTGNTRIPATEITGVYGGLVKVAMRRMIGEVPESAGVMWHNPRVFKDLMAIGQKSEKWDALDENLYSVAMCQTPPTITDELSDALLAELGPAAMLELAAKVGLMNASARANIALGIRSEGYADACGLPPLAPRSTEVVSGA